MRKKKVFFINGIILTGTSILMRCAGLVFNIFISNQIGSEAVGIFSLVMSVYLFFVTIANSGLSMAVTCVLSEELAKNRVKEAMKAIRTGLFFALLLGVLAGFLIIIISPQIASIFLHNLVSNKPFYLIGIGLPFIAMSSCINGYFNAVRKSYKTAFSQILELIVKIVTTFIFLNIVLVKGVEAICIALILADVIAEICSFLYVYILYWLDKKKENFSSVKVLGQKRKLFGLSFPVAITSYIRSGLSTLKQLMIPMQLEKSGLSCSLALSQYGIVNGMAMPLLMFSNVFIMSFSNLLIPEFSTYLAQNNQRAIHFICDKIFRLTSIFSILIASIFVLFSNDISLLAYQNLESSLFLKILAPLVFFMYLDSVIDSILKGLNKQFAVMCCNVLDLTITILFIYFLLPILGIYGYLVSIFISELLNFFVSFIQLLKYTKLKINWSDWLIKPMISLSLSFSLFIFLPKTFTSNLILNVILRMVLFISIYLSCCFLLKIIQKKDIFS